MIAGAVLLLEGTAHSAASWSMASGDQQAAQISGGLFYAGDEYVQTNAALVNGSGGKA